jgi:hypothetical protein
MPFSVKKIKGIDTSDLEKLGASVVDLAKYTEDEFSQVASALQGTDPNPIWNVPLPRPRRGTTVYADGTNWNPGSGEGPYWFDGTLYHPMGQNYNPATVVKTVKVQKFTASGTYTPSAGMLYCIIEGVGSGGGGGGASAGTTTGTSFGAGGGGAGGYSRLTATAATIGGSQTVTIGAAGAGGAAGANNGGNGGDCSVGTLLIAKGGSGGKFVSPAQMAPGGAGGVPGTGDITCAGQPGTYGLYNGSRATVSILASPGNGGSSFFGGGAVHTVTNGAQAVNGVNAGNYGGGGSGAFVDALANGNASGGNGSTGLILIVEFCSQ